jgi:ligand-binding SRPBCC domain-containing protein
VPVFEYSSSFACTVERLWAFHERPDVIRILTPPFTPMRIIRQQGGLEVGSEKEFALGLWPLEKLWLARHVEYQRGVLFADLQVKGPFRYWLHRHHFTAEGNGSRLTDRVEYEFYGGPLLDGFVRWQLGILFRHRHAATARYV